HPPLAPPLPPCSPTRRASDLAAAARPRVRALRPSRHVRTVTPFVRRVLPTAWPISPIPSRPTFTAEYPPVAGGQGNSGPEGEAPDRKSTRLNSSHQIISYAVF